jgi:hypothetical protein
VRIFGFVGGTTPGDVLEAAKLEVHLFAFEAMPLGSSYPLGRHWVYTNQGPYKQDGIYEPESAEDLQQ